MLSILSDCWLQEGLGGKMMMMYFYTKLAAFYTFLETLQLCYLKF